jgi:cellulose synthase (UDP-forming)
VLIALNFVTLGVVMPVFTDVSQMLGAIPISRAAFVGLLRPKGHPFRVTAKGGDRSRVTIQWALLAPFAVVLALTLIGLVLGIFSDRFAFYDAGDGKAIVLFWTLYNVVVLCFTILVCIELPRRERHVADSPERAVVLINDLPDQEVWLVGLAQDRVRVRGADLPVGTKGYLRIREVGDVEFLALATTSDGARLSLHPTEEQHTALLERFYTDGEAPGVLNVRLAALFEGISRRLSFNDDRR